VPTRRGPAPPATRGRGRGPNAARSISGAWSPCHLLIFSFVDPHSPSAARRGQAFSLARSGPTRPTPAATGLFPPRRGSPDPRLFLPPPWWGRVGVGGTGSRGANSLTPHPNPPPQGGREQKAVFSLGARHPNGHYGFSVRAQTHVCLPQPGQPLPYLRWM